MKSYWSLGHRIPRYLSKSLFGDRRKFGLEKIIEDPDWVAWQDFYLEFYKVTQKQGIGKTVNDAGYQVLSMIDLNNKRIMEIGPGIIPHIPFWVGKPLHYSLVDNLQSLLDQTAKILDSAGVEYSCDQINSHLLPFTDEEFDIVLSFYSLEHIYPMDKYLEEFKRVLKPGGLFVGAIPSEGGLAWGLGRFLTSRRFLKKNTSINPDKIICWEHPNFAEDILEKLDSIFTSISKKFYPLYIPLVDINLVISFVYRNGSE